MALVVYGDFTDPLSRIASRRTDVLRAAGGAVEWRAVAGHRSTRVLASPVDVEFQQRIVEVQAWLEAAALPGEPTGVPTPSAIVSPDPAVAAYAEAVGAGLADYVRRLLFKSYWLHGRDIGSPEVLRGLLAVPIRHGHSTSTVLARSGYAVAINGGPITTTAWRLIRQWRDEWEDLGKPVLPVVLDAETVKAGYDAAEHLGVLMATREHDFATAGEYPLPPLPPPVRRVGVARAGQRPAWWDA